MACMNFIILKVNGIDVSNFPHEDAVQVFLNAPEPIVVELKRRSTGMDSLNSSTTSSSRSSDATNSVKNTQPQLVTTGVQTVASTATIDCQFVEQEFLYDESPVSDHPDDECLPPDIDIEEITLRKAKSEDRIGLTVSYSSANGSGSDDTETCTEVFITDIIAESVAARDGRLRQGDQILQVNGRDVTTKEETESLFAENKNAVTLLVSRCIYSGDDDLLDAEDDFEEDFPPPPPSLLNAVTSTTTTMVVEMRTNSEKDSGHDSNRLSTGSLILSADDPLNHKNIKAQMEAWNQEISALDHRVEHAFKHDVYRQPIDTEPKVLPSPSGRKPPTFPNIPAPPPIDSDTEHIYETIPEDSEPEPIYCSPYESSDQSIVEQWLKMNKINEGTKAMMKKALISKQSPQQENKVWQKTTKSNSSGEDHENSSSAYNTGGSCNSNHLTLELNFSPDKDMSRSTMVLCPQKSKEKKVNGMENGKLAVKGKEKKSPKRYPIPTSNSNHMLTSPGGSFHASTSQPGTPMSPMGGQIPDFKEKVSRTNTNPLPLQASTMYTNMANLHQTMLLQQKLFRQALTQQNTISNVKHYTAPNLSQYQFVSGQQVYRTSLQPRTNEENMVWKVKRRQDGSRYIVRRPVNRTKVMKERAVKIAEERNELTTEDDTVSEIKLGRFWTKEERKKHMEKAKERRHRQEAMIAAKNQQLNENGGGGGGGNFIRVNGLPPTIPKSKSTETHRRASMRKNNNYEHEKPASINGKAGLLSVTTV